ncbi:MAG TPA: molybdenum-dependent transcriptional regulator [Epsilonproteobacteria bacterium]|nr:molybdenum-dependent transcriptional regulator [Campylobacterota bacterium]
MELSSGLTLEILGQPFLLEKRIELLRAIKEHGSISKAARAVPMSYKSAWEAIDTMNTLSIEPIVERETGGKNGGGTTVTAYGLKLLETYKVLKEEHTHFLQRLAEVTNVESGEFKTIGRLALQLSARNQIAVEVQHIDSHSVNANIILKLKCGQILHAVITQEAVDNLQIQEGQTVTALFKSNMVLVSSHTKQIKNTNVIEGVISEIASDKENVKLTVDIGTQDKIVSVMPQTDVDKKLLLKGNSVKLLIRNHDIMIGR